MGNSRRDFLTLLVYGLGTALSPELLLSRPSLAKGKEAGGVSVTVTGGDKRLAGLSPLEWRAVDAQSKDVIVIDASKKYQSILGFGGAFTDASCYTFNKMEAKKRKAILDQLFGKSDNGLGLNVCRTCIGASDYSRNVYSFDEGEPDPELKRFSIAHDQEYILPVLRQARAVNPDLFLFSTPWSPPGWMKSNNSMLGGNMRRQYMSSYAEYFVKFLQGYEREGVPIQAITVQNEVDTDQDGKMPACAWPQEYEADFVRFNLGPAFAKNNIKTKIWLIDHNYNLWGRAIGEMETPDVLKYASGIAWHGYVGDVAKMSQVHNAFPDVDQYWTEGGPDYTDPHYGDNWTTWGKSFSGILRNWCRSLTVWNLSLDEKGKPNIGPFPCGGLVTVNSSTDAISYSGQYFALGHFSKFVQRGAIRVDSQASIDGLEHVAFQNPGGGMVLVVTNSGAERRLSVKVGDKAVELEMARDSMATLSWT
ncbi:MAG: glycosyl hydrolase [Cyanobacteria bacterium SZAS TMP-1]|nr:glycosyl hydrolase [Cyanobacteria bacterium SZAS TMP-1]